MFYRESEGIYQFGTKRVNIRVENNKITVRVGGGYLLIEEFLDQYTPTEMEKLARQDPFKKSNDRAFQMMRFNSMIAGGDVKDPSGSPGGSGSPSFGGA